MFATRTTTYLAVWAALLLLLGLSLGVSFLPLGALQPTLELAFAATQALLVAVFFMHLQESSPLVRLAAAVALVWLTILFGLTLADYVTRGWYS